MNAPGAWLGPLGDLAAYSLDVERHTKPPRDTPNNLQLLTTPLTSIALTLCGTALAFSVVQFRTFFAVRFPQDGSIDNRPVAFLRS